MSQELQFEKKRVLVVGGSSGIGNAIARAFRSKGASVHIWGTRANAVEYANSGDSDLSGLHYKQVDVSVAEQVRRCDAEFETLDVLVLSQGIALYSQAEFEPGRFRHVVDVNLNSLMECCARFYTMLKASAGSIIIISSTAALHSTRGNPAYGASKTGALGLTRTLGDAWAPDGIRVNGIAPGMIPTKMTRVTTDNPNRVEAWKKQIPLGRLGTTSEIAGVALFLASPLASYVIGQTIPVDGGLTLR
ncbi:SDR family oxidoreductase [Bradyrhizobium sp. KBS0727]|uniref:SDR family NAD(P)-dependent oxidoreductase n=1 Tax=unclassified Bradyrhizobium TaxID=2631580 RepID=UPI00110D74A0|nr:MULTISPECIES: SDR family oxidoreductase [unclassified Bradyrhizobium]QDW40619.1 SDR family oxidoreductase [Bradyrhizobium sp. KBS0725]QDW47224.1 SDR family oxidoreductase [Bradyrhizobium sp. KBS0727]